MVGAASSRLALVLSPLTRLVAAARFDPLEVTVAVLDMMWAPWVCGATIALALPKAPRNARRALSWGPGGQPTTSTNAYGAREVQSVLSALFSGS